MTKSRKRWLVRLRRLAIAVAIFIAIFLMALVFGWRYAKKTFGIEYAEMHYVFPSYVSFQDLSWNVEGTSTGNAAKLELDWTWRDLLRKQVHISKLLLDSAQINLNIETDTTSEPVELPGITIDKVDIRRTHISYAQSTTQAATEIPALQLADAGYSKSTGWHLNSLRFEDLTANYSSDSLNFTNDTLPLNLDLSSFAFDPQGQVTVEFLGLAARRESVQFQDISVRADSTLDLRFRLDSSLFTVAFLRQIYPDMSIFVHPDFPDSEVLQLASTVHYASDQLEFQDGWLSLMDSTRAEFKGTIDLSDDAVPLDIFINDFNTTRTNLKYFLKPRSFDSMFQYPSRANGPVHLYGDAAHLSIKGSLNSPEGKLEARTFIEMEDLDNIYYEIGIASDDVVADAIIDYLPIALPSAQIDLLIQGLTSETPGRDTFKLHTTSRELILEGYALGGITFDYYYNADYDSLWATVDHPAVEAAFLGDIYEVHPDTTAVRWSGTLGHVVPQLLESAVPGWTLAGEYNGAYYYGDYAYSRIEFGLQDPEIYWPEGDSAAVSSLQLSYAIAGARNTLNLNTQRGDELWAFYEGSIPGWSDDWRLALEQMPELGVRFSGELDSGFVHRLAGVPFGASIENIDLAHNADSLEWSLDLDIPRLQFDQYSTREIGGQIHYRFRHFDGVLAVQTFSGAGVEGSDLEIAIDRAVEQVNWSVRLGNMNDLGSSRFAIVQYNDRDGYRLALKEDEPLELVGHAWTVQEDEGLAFDRDFSLKYGSVGMRSGPTQVTVKTDSTLAIDLLIDSLQLESLTEAISGDTTFHGSIKMMARYDLITERTAVELDVFDLGTDSIELGHWQACGTYDDSLQVHVLFDKGLKNSFADVSVANGQMHFVAEVIDFDLTVLNQGFLPPDVTLNGSLSGAVVGRYTDDLYADGWLNIDRGLIMVPGTETPYILKGDSLHFVDDHLEFHDFKVYDKYDRPLSVSGRLNTIPDLWYDLELKGENFTFLDQRKGEMLRGNASGRVDVVLKGTDNRLWAEGELDLLQGSYIRYQVANSISVDRTDRVVRFTNFNSESAIDSADAASEAESEMKMKLDLSVRIDESDFDVVINPISQEYVRLKATGDLSIAKSWYGDPEINGYVEGKSGRALISLPVVPSVNMDIEEARVSWSGRYDQPLIRFLGTEKFNTSIDGIPQFENRVGLVPVTLQLKIDDADLSELDVLLDVDTEDPELNSYFTSLTADQRMGLATNLLLFGTLMPDGESGTNMAMGAAAAKLNELAHRNFENTDLNFAMTSAKEYDEFGMEQEATRLNYSFRKGFFQNRLYVSIGGDLGIASLESDGYRPPSHYIGNVSLNYRLAEGSPWTLKGARTESYEGVIDGELTKYSLGLGFYKSYPTFWSIFGIDRETSETD